MTYKVLIVDDEKNIRMGIANNCAWTEYGIGQVMTACNGQEALQLILNEKPDIVITDIKMPIMDGLELIKKTAELYPDTLFAVLSGYDDFDFARTALKHNAIDYLLKPCSIESIHELLKNAVDRLNEREEKKEFLQKILDDYHKLENRLEEQAFKDYIINPVTRKESLTEYAPFSSIKEQPFRLLLLHTDDASQAVCTFSLMQIAREILQKTHRIFLCTICSGQVLLVLEYLPYPGLRKDLLAIKEAFGIYYDQSITIAVGEKTSLDKIKESYRNLLTYLHSQFFIGNDNIITTFDLPSISKPLSVNNFQMEFLELAMKSGNHKELDEILNQLFKQLNDLEYNVEQIKAFSIQLYLYIIQQADTQEYMQYLDKIIKIKTCTQLLSIHSILQETAHTIISTMYENVQRNTHEIIKKILLLIDEHLADEKLSLSFIANQILYVNVDYLGKLFKTETGEKFSKYVTDKRIKKAKELFLSDPAIAVNEVALLTGFGYNAQYFSKVFKSCTGYTPKEYHNKFCIGEI